jgi:hypothetical protein
VGNSGWTADPNDITLPPGAADSDPRIYIGPNDPLAQAFGQDSAILFYFGPGRAFMLSVEQSGGPNLGQLFLSAVSSGNPPLQLLGFEYDVAAQNASGGLHLPGNASIAAGVGTGAIPGSILFIQEDQVGVVADVWLYGQSMPRFLRQKASFTANSGAVGTTESSVATLASQTYKADRAYEMRIVGRHQLSAAANTGQWRVRKTNTAGQVLADWGQVGVTVAAVPFALCLTGAVFTVGGTDVTAALLATAQSSAGTVTMIGSATMERKFEIWDCGAATEFPNAPVLV